MDLGEPSIARGSASATKIQTDSHSPCTSIMIPPNVQPAPQLQTLHKIKSFLGLEFLLRCSMRVAGTTALPSFISFHLIQPLGQKRMFSAADSYAGMEDPALVIWLGFSTAFFFPCAILVDLGLCGAIIKAIRVFPNNQLFVRWVPSTSSKFYLYQLSSLVEFLAVMLIGFLRTLDLALALAETRYSARNASNYPSIKEYIGLITKPQYDWWTFKPLPEEFISRPWYKRLCRPWFPFAPQASSSMLQAHHQEAVTPYLTIFFGAKIFRARRNEWLWLVLVRGIVAIACLAALMVYSTNVLFLQPYEESQAPPIRIQPLKSSSIGTKMPSPTWGIVIGINTRYTPLPSGFDFDSFLSVTKGAQGVPSEDLSRCSSTKVPEINDNPWDSYELISYQCALLWADGPQAHTPQIDVQADYAGLNISRSNFTTEGSLMVWPSFTSNVRNVLASTKPMSLMIGSNLIARVDGTISASFTDPTRATFGFRSNQDLYITGRVSKWQTRKSHYACPLLSSNLEAILGTDPFLSGARPDGFASMRFINAAHTSDWKLYSDTRQNTVLGGLSELGGLSVFLNSVFLILFGGSLMLVLFDVKPLSIFGLLHYFSKITISNHFKTEFPQLHREGEQPGDSGSGLIAFTRAYMLDLGPPSEVRRKDRDQTSLAAEVSSPRGGTVAKCTDGEFPPPSNTVKPFLQ